ncbi:hypothetical protein [Winogradskyella sp. MH6]|uniref:hypothetical protein n=1 Tax=Winogradskyella sp. MH6 TaxID=2929510 RepID=UPI001FB51B1F|nr:hypothetical protein [Winogradskyella sp. MH6]
MKIRILLIFILIAQLANSQITLTDYFIVNNERVEIEILKTDGKYKIKMSKGGDNKEFVIGNNVGDFYDFRKQFRKSVYVELLGKSLIEGHADYDISILKRVDEEAESTYYSFANNLRVLDDLEYKPKTGDLKINDQIPVYMKKKVIGTIFKDKLEDEAKKEFKSKVVELDNLIQADYTNNLQSIIKLANELNIEEYENISTASETLSVKETNSKTLIAELLSFKDKYKKYRQQYVKVLMSQYENTKDSAPFTYLIIDEVQVEFYKGFLEIIKVNGHFKCNDDMKFNCAYIPSFLKDETSITFTNLYGIGFTSRTNYKRLDNVRLYINQANKQFRDVDINILGEEQRIYEKKLREEFFIRMDDIMVYDFYVNKLTRDFSPMDQKLTVKGGEKLTLTKEQTRKILEVEVFSDFEGFDADTPNGLIQMELSKHFNINTKRIDASRPFKFISEGWGLFQYTEIVGGITKIEDNQRRLNPERIDTEVLSNDGITTVIDAKRYTTPTDLLNYRDWYIGQDFNLLLIDNPNLKHQFHINGGLRFNRTAIQDSIQTVGADNLKEEQYSLSYWTFYPEFLMHILPEERYGFYAMWRPNYVHLASDRVEFKSLADPVTGFRRKVSNWMNEFEFKGYVDVGSNGQLFLRWRLFHEMGYSANNFSQIQLGFSFYLLGRNKESLN